MITNASDSVLPPTANAPGKSPWLAGALAIAAVILVGLNLRMGIASASPLFHDLQEMMGYGTFIASLLPTIPVLCFAVAGAATSLVIRRTGLELGIALSLLLLTAGLALRIVDSTWALLAGTVVGMCGLAICNVAMPSFIREHHGNRAASMTAAYTTTMSIGATLASAISVPLAVKAGSPTTALALWAIPAGLALLVFVPLSISGKRSAVQKGTHVSPWPLLATRKGLLFTTVFGIQSLLVYTVVSWLPHILISRGLEPVDAGLMLGIVQGVSIPAVMIMLWMASKPALLRSAFVLTTSCSVLGFIALLLLPVELSLISSVLIGLGFGVFPLVMLMLSRSGGSAEETTAMSTVAQSVGYLIAAIGPFALGLMQGALGSWTVGLVIILAFAVVQLLFCYKLGGLRTEADSHPLIEVDGSAEAERP
ncbi:CynX/NimT family MFS transporter [Micrococcus antarcticus]|uniref:MFS transporter n=1 Tax=Glutamicibacter sp. NPDC087673 TaxID=3363997 RepID=UPI00362B3B9E